MRSQKDASPPRSAASNPGVALLVVVLLAMAPLAGCSGGPAGEPGIEPAGGEPAGTLDSHTTGGPAPDSGADPERVIRSPRPLSVAEAALVEAGNDFTFRLLRAAGEDQRERNLFLSPLSASMALTMAANGAAGGTLDAMRRTLGFGALEMSTINASYQALVDLLVGLDGGIDLGVANSVWYRRGWSIEAPFLRDVRTSFGAQVEALDFGDPAAKDVINGWVGERTNGRITELVEEIDPDHVMFLINAVYFQGRWVEPFDPGATRDHPFRRADGGTSTVRMMSRWGGFGAFSEGGVIGVDLPYGGGAYSMVAVLPEVGGSLDSLIASLDPARWAGWLAALREVRYARIELPRLKLEYEVEMNDMLRKMGMDIAFTGDADFTRMFRPGGLMISRVRQKTFLEVDEQGTEAAAATSVEMIPASASMSYTFDRPFLLVIRERFSGTILFIGKIVDPSGG